MAQPKEAQEIAKRTVGVDLSLLERMMLLGLLPDVGDVTSLRLIRELRESLATDEEENERFEIRFEGAITRWKDEKAKQAQPKHFELIPRAFTIIESTLNRLDRQEKLPLNALTLYDKFCEKHAKSGA